jgi:hypothetical protein
MRIPKPPTLIQNLLQHRLKKPAPAPPVLAASLGTSAHRCGRPSCRGQHGGPWPTGKPPTSKAGGKARSAPAPEALLPEVRTWLAEHRHLKALLQEIHRRTVALLRARACFLKLKAGRP